MPGAIKSRVLIADDDRISSKMLAGLLRKWGYEAEVVHDGVEAQRALMKEDAPQLAILDWMMPGLDGIDVIRNARLSHHGPYKYMLLLTSKGQKEDLLEGLDAGADGYLRKPLDPAELRAHLLVGARILAQERRLLSAQETAKEQRSIIDSERKMLRALIDNIPEFMYVKDLQSRFILANPQVARAVGIENPEELMGKTDFDLYPAELAKSFYADEQEVIRSGKPMFNREEKSVDHNGNETHILTTKVPLRDGSGQVTGIAGVGRDITDSRKMEDALREAERKYRGIFNEAIVGIYQVTTSGQLLSVNPAMARMSGYESPEEMMALVTDVPGQLYADARRRDELIQSLKESGSVQDFEFEMVCKDGRKIWVTTSALAIRENGEVVRFEGMTQDITERKKAEQSLNLMRILMDQSNDAIEVMDPETLRFLDFNERACANLGYSREELLSRTVFEINPTLDEASLKALTEQLQKSGSLIRQTRYRRKDGSTFPVEVSIKQVQLDRAYHLCVVRDITERQEAQQQLLQAQKLESIGQLAAGIAHEINTPTQYIGDNIRFLKDAFRDLKGLVGSYDRLLEGAKGNAVSAETVREVVAAVEGADVGYLLEEIPKAIEQSLEGVSRVAALVSAMKDFSHPGTKDKTPVDLNRAIESTITVARNEWKYVADMETDYDASLAPVSCLPGEFNQVILNLIVNAAHAIADVVEKGGSQKGKIRVQTRNCAEWAEIRIQDSGSGIPEKVRSRIFDPFFTTKQIGKGTGQGLAIARSVIVDKHAGSIHFETEEGKGTTFIIRIPHEGTSLAAKAVAK
ncbi:MAG: PAS domain S-box protein [Terriglobales bacterium]